MGWGDELMGSGIAKGAAQRGVRIAFGDRKRIIWTPEAHQIFAGNPNVAHPGDERDGDLEWVAHYQGHRLYHSSFNSFRFFYDMNFKAKPGEVFFTTEELNFADQFGDDFVVIEPNVKPSAINKQWPQERYQHVANHLTERNIRVAQFAGLDGKILHGAERIVCPSFRTALAVLGRSQLYIGPEGGLHHGAAAVGKPAVVIFGGFTPVSATGYGFHTNISVGSACGSRGHCPHCATTMASISAEFVTNEVLRRLEDVGLT